MAVKISFLRGHKLGVLGTVSFAASITSWYLCNDMQNFSLVLFLYMNIICIAQWLWCYSETLHCSHLHDAKHFLNHRTLSSKHVKKNLQQKYDVISQLRHSCVKGPFCVTQLRWFLPSLNTKIFNQMKRLQMMRLTWRGAVPSTSHTTTTRRSSAAPIYARISCTGRSRAVPINASTPCTRCTTAPAPVDSGSSPSCAAAPSPANAGSWPPSAPVDARGLLCRDHGSRVTEEVC